MTWLTAWLLMIVIEPRERPMQKIRAYITASGGRRENKKSTIGIVNDQNEIEGRRPNRAVIAGKTKLARKFPIAIKDRRPPAVAKFMPDSAIREGMMAPKDRMTIPLTKYP